MKLTSADIQVQSSDRATIVPPFSGVVEIGSGFHLVFEGRAPLGKVEAFVKAFNDLQKAIQDVEGAGRD